MTDTITRAPRLQTPRFQAPRRSLLLTLLAGLTGCVVDAPPPPLAVVQPDYSYLTKLRLNVATLAIDDSWTPRADSGLHVESLSPIQPIDALRRMGQDRLVAQGTSGQARFVVTDASILQMRGRLDGSFAVRLEVATSDGARSGFAEARVVRVRTLTGDEADGGRAAAYELTRRMMDDLNVEFEFQVRHSLGDYLLASGENGAAVAPPAPVQSQDLGTPGGPVPLTPAPPTVQQPSVQQPGVQQSPPRFLQPPAYPPQQAYPPQPAYPPPPAYPQPPSYYPQ